MNSNNYYDTFQRNLESILDDTIVLNPTEEELNNNRYFFHPGIWAGTEKSIYFYDKHKLESHRQEILSMCKQLPKFNKPTDEHAGTISGFDTLPPVEVFSQQSREDALYSLDLSNNFAHLVCALQIGKVGVVAKGKDKIFLIVLDKIYRSYFESED